MPALICKACGASGLMEEGRFYVCPYCDTRFPKSDFRASGISAASDASDAVTAVPVIDFGATARGKNVERLLEKADLYWDMGRVAKAVDLYLQVLDIEPDNAKAKKRLEG